MPWHCGMAIRAASLGVRAGWKAFVIQKATIAVLLAALLAGTASADPSAGLLAPSKPAGVKQAQLRNNETVFIGAISLVIGVGLYLASGHYNLGGGAASAPPSPPATTTH